MRFKIGDKVRLLPQDDQYKWVSEGGMPLTDKIGEVIAAYKKYPSFKGYGILFLDAPSSHSTGAYVIEGRHLIKVDDDDWSDAQPNLVAKWSDCSWSPYKNKV